MSRRPPEFPETLDDLVVATPQTLYVVSQNADGQADITPEALTNKGLQPVIADPETSNLLFTPAEPTPQTGWEVNGGAEVASANTKSFARPEREEPFSGLTAFVPDSVVGGAVILLVLTGVQRLIGFVRAVWFCRHLAPEELGKWEVLFSFLNLAAPLVIFSLPGTFGRYAERYRRQGQLRSFLRQTALVCAGLTAAAGLAMLAGQGPLDQLLFDGVGAYELLSLLPCTLASVIAFNYLTELFTSLRGVRLSAAIFFLNSVLFAALGVGLLVFWRNDALSVTSAYGLSNLLAAAAGLWLLGRNYALLPPDSAPLDQAGFWRLLAPFAFSVWTINLITNLFSIVDRYLIVHFAPSDGEAALALVGQYHSSRLLPLLVLSVIQMLGAMILPYMSAEWESGQRAKATIRLRLALKLLAFWMTGLAALCMAAAPLLFHTTLGGKFQASQQLLPGTLIYCIWFGLALTAQNYLWCAEKAFLATAAMSAGLTANVALNCWLLPRWGLEGVVVGTSLSHLTALGIMLALASRLGFQPDKALIAMLVLPACLILGPGWAMTIWALVGLLGLVFGAFWTDEEKQLLPSGLGDWRIWFLGFSTVSKSLRRPEPLP